MCRDPLRMCKLYQYTEKYRNFNQDIIDKIGADLQLNRVAPGLAKYVRSRPGGQYISERKRKK